MKGASRSSCIWRTIRHHDSHSSFANSPLYSGHLKRTRFGSGIKLKMKENTAMISW
jgi:hypothetical protein